MKGEISPKELNAHLQKINKKYSQLQKKSEEIENTKKRSKN